MSESMLKQLLYEINTWKRSLAYMQEEGVHWKCRLSEIVNEDGEGRLLETAENFQNSFMTEDDIIKVLREEVNEQETLLQDLEKDSPLLKGIIKNQHRIRKDMARAEHLFQKMKTDFDTYLSGAFS